MSLKLTKPTDVHSIRPRGRITKEESEKLLAGFLEIYRRGGVTCVMAAHQMGTSYPTAQRFFHICNKIIAETNFRQEETWFDTRDRIIIVALESLAVQIQELRDAKDRVDQLRILEYSSYRDVLDENKMVDDQRKKIQVDDLSPVAEKLEKKHNKGIAHRGIIISNIAKLDKQSTDLSMQITHLVDRYNGLAMKPPSEAILEQELELHINGNEERDAFK